MRYLMTSAALSVEEADMPLLLHANITSRETQSLYEWQPSGMNSSTHSLLVTRPSLASGS
jgi:hypothetical protein